MWSETRRQISTPRIRQGGQRKRRKVDLGARQAEAALQTTQGERPTPRAKETGAASTRSHRTSAGGMRQPRYGLSVQCETWPLSKDALRGVLVGLGGGARGRGRLRGGRRGGKLGGRAAPPPLRIFLFLGPFLCLFLCLLLWSFSLVEIGRSPTMAAGWEGGKPHYDGGRECWSGIR